VISGLPVSCSVSDLTFTFTTLSFNPVAAGNSLEINGTSAVGGDVTLDFEVISGATPTYPLDVTLLYTVTSTSTDISGIDAQFGAGLAGSIAEDACSAPALITGCPKGTLYSQHRRHEQHGR